MELRFFSNQGPRINVISAHSSGEEGCGERMGMANDDNTAYPRLLPLALVNIFKKNLIEVH